MTYTENDRSCIACVENTKYVRRKQLERLGNSECRDGLYGTNQQETIAGQKDMVENDVQKSVDENATLDRASGRKQR